MEIRCPKPIEYEAVKALSLSHLSPAAKEQYLAINPESAKFSSSLIDGTAGVCFVAVASGAIVGYAMGAIKGTPLTTVRFAELTDLKVDPDFRNQGLGGQLAKAFIVWSKGRADRLCVTAHANNSAAIRFYQRLGFTPQSLELEREL